MHKKLTVLTEAPQSLLILFLSPSPKYLKGLVLHSLHILLAWERISFTLIERHSCFPPQKSSTQQKNPPLHLKLVLISEKRIKSLSLHYSLSF